MEEGRIARNENLRGPLFEYDTPGLISISLMQYVSSAVTGGKACVKQELSSVVASLLSRQPRTHSTSRTRIASTWELLPVSTGNLVEPVILLLASEEVRHSQAGHWRVQVIAGGGNGLRRHVPVDL